MKLTEAFQGCCTDPCCQPDLEETFLAQKRHEETKLPFSQKTSSGQKDLRFPNRFHEFLEAPTDIIVQLWGEDGTRYQRTIRKAKVMPKTWKGAPSTWVRRTVREERTGKLLSDEFAPLSDVLPKRNVAIFSNKVGQVLLLRNKEGKLDFPS